MKTYNITALKKLDWRAEHSALVILAAPRARIAITAATEA